MTNSVISFGPATASSGTSRTRFSGGTPGFERLPYSLKVLLEDLLRNEDGTLVTADQVRAVGERGGQYGVGGGTPRCAFCRTSPACPAWWISPT